MKRLKHFIGILFLFFVLTILNCTKKVSSPDNYVASVSEPVVNLNGNWKMSLTLDKAFWKNSVLDDSWKDIKVPGEVMMQGFSIKNDIPFAYKKEIKIPSDYKGKNIFLQFDGVYSYARVWINDNYVRDHFGGFTRWKCDITQFVKPGEKVWVTVEVTDKADDISYGSGYAKHQIGGILRDVSLIALPRVYPEDIKIVTDLDGNYINADLNISGKLNKVSEHARIELRLYDKDQKEIKLKKPVYTINKESGFKITNPVNTPEKWDAEHPNLYTLQILFYTNDDLQWSKKYKFGFRKVSVENNIFLVNGKPVKLRGACRHDIHPLLGRVSTPEYELQDVLLAKESNMNYIRTSHYPPTDNFLSLCDEYGIYVEDETAVCFIINYRIEGYKAAENSQSNPSYTDRYLSQLEEMVNTHKNHPSVVIWSIGNESVFGTNFQKSYDWVKANDKTRPVMFSYPGTAPDSIAPYQILSMHYPDIDGDLDQYAKKTKGFGHSGIPVIFDEWAHVACYNNETIKLDPNIRNFWGQSLDMMWAKTFDADGGLGGAIWGMIDETFMLPEDLEGFRDWWGIEDPTVSRYKGTTVGYGEWGIIDIWRRKKPEFWNTKKAYSPVKLLETTVKDYTTGKPVSLLVYNRFDHTNLNEISIKYSYKGKIKTLENFSLKPHKKGILNLPVTDWDVSEVITVDFLDHNSALIDRYRITQKDDEDYEYITPLTTKKITMEDKVKELIIHTSKGNLIVNKNTGLLEKIGDMKISGPFLNYRTEGKNINYSTYKIDNYGKNWKLKKFSYKPDGKSVKIDIKGNYEKVSVHFELAITADGQIKTKYSYSNLPDKYIREIGIRYDLDPIFDELYWKRRGYWSTYPENHISTLSGKVKLYSDVIKKYRQEPKKSWSKDSKSFYYNGTEPESTKDLTKVAKATKENCLEYSLLKYNKKQLTVSGKEQNSCRIERNDTELYLFLNSELDYTNLNWGNYERMIKPEDTFTGEINLLLLQDN